MSRLQESKSLFVVVRRWIADHAPPQHLVEYLPQLHSFLKVVGNRILQEDKAIMYEAIAHVITAMPMEQAAQSLRLFAMDILALVHAAGARPTPATKEELKVIGGELVLVGMVCCLLIEVSLYRRD